MADTLTPCFLDWRTIDKAYPLVRDTIPGVTVNRWVKFSRAHLARRSPDRPRGVMTIQNAAGYILALFVFEVRDDLYASRILYLDHPERAGTAHHLGLCDRRRRESGEAERLPRDSG